MKKNERYITDIIDMGTEGEGIAKIDGFTLFVENAVKGDRADILVTKVNKNFGYARLMEIKEPSPIRCSAFCDVSRVCGGCSLQHIKYESQLEYKTQSVRDKLERIGGFKGFMPEKAIGMDKPYNYRNKAQLPVRKDKDGNIAIGFYAKRSHRVINVESCGINPPCTAEIIKTVKRFMIDFNIEPYNEETNSGIIRHILIRTSLSSNETLVCIVINNNNLPYADKLVDMLIKTGKVSTVTLNINTEKTNVILGKKNKVLYGTGIIKDKIGELEFEISPMSFFQVNPVQTNILYSKALEFADLENGTETVFDVYCGIGTISLFLAQKAKKVYGVEIVKEAIADAERNAVINNIKNAEFTVGKAEEEIPKLYERGIKADVIVVDPPRKGCDEKLLEVICLMKPKRVVYVSCDPATLARDLKYLCQNGFSLEKAQPVDMFCHTPHVETVCLLSKKP